MSKRDLRNVPCNDTRGTLTCKLPGQHEMHEDPTRGKWKHPRLPHGIRKRPKPKKG